jgi:hypothetical protein
MSKRAGAQSHDAVRKVKHYRMRLDQLANEIHRDEPATTTSTKDAGHDQSERAVDTRR